MHIVEKVFIKAQHFKYHDKCLHKERNSIYSSLTK